MQNWEGAFLVVESILNPRPTVFVDCEVTSLFQVTTYFEGIIKLHTITSEN